MRPIGVGIIGTGWCGGIRAETCASHPLVESLHLAEIRPDRLRELAAKTGAKTATADYRELLRSDEIDAIIISATPESTHYPSFADGALYHSAISWALPVVWPGAVYSLEVGIVGTEGVLTIDDTHRDIVLATAKSQGEGYAPDQSRRVDFLGSYPPGDIALGELRGPMREETESWLNRLALGLPTQHATAADGHNRLMLTKAFDLSARLRRVVRLPIAPEDEQAGV
jgi:predicted dehydrogenase